MIFKFRNECLSFFCVSAKIYYTCLPFFQNEIICTSWLVDCCSSCFKGHHIKKHKNFPSHLPQNSSIVKKINQSRIISHLSLKLRMLTKVCMLLCVVKFEYRVSHISKICFYLKKIQNRKGKGKPQ